MDDYEYDYFMIRVRRRLGESCDPGVAGVVERLDTGEKHTFGSGAELLGVVLHGQPRASNGPGQSAVGNESHKGASGHGADTPRRAP